MAQYNNVALIVGESIVLTSDRDILTLTNYRVRYHSKSFGASKYVSVLLENISSCGLVTQSYPILLLLAFVMVVIEIFSKFQSQGGLIVSGIVMALVYLVTRKSVICISSNGGEKIAVPISGMKKDKVISFLEAVSSAQLKSIGKI